MHRYAERLKNKMNFEGIKHYLKILALVAIVILIFTAIDFLTHLLSESFAVPEYYFRNKIIYALLWGFLIYLFIEKMKPLKKSLIFSAAISIILQLRYFLEGYPKWFVFLFLALHFIMLEAASYTAFKISDKYEFLKMKNNKPRN